MKIRANSSFALAIFLAALAGLGAGFWHASRGGVGEQPGHVAQANAGPVTTPKPQDIVILRADGTLDTYTVPFPIDLVERTTGKLLVSGCTESLCYDMLPIPFAEGDTVLKIGEAQPQAPPAGALPTPTVGPPTADMGIQPRQGN